MADVPAKSKTDRQAGGGHARPLHPLCAPHLARHPGDGRDRRGQHPASSVHRRHVAWRVHAAAAHQAARQADRHHAGAALRRRVPGRGAQALRHAVDPRRRRRRPQQGPRRHPRLQVGHPGAARRSRGGDDGGRAGRTGAQGRARHRHGARSNRARRDPAGRHRHHAIPRAQHLEPDEDQPAPLEPGLCRRAPSCRCRARRLRRSSRGTGRRSRTT